MQNRDFVALSREKPFQASGCFCLSALRGSLPRPQLALCFSALLCVFASPRDASPAFLVFWSSARQRVLRGKFKILKQSPLRGLPDASRSAGGASLKSWPRPFRRFPGRLRDSRRAGWRFRSRPGALFPVHPHRRGRCGRFFDFADLGIELDSDPHFLFRHFAGKLENRST